MSEYTSVRYSNISTNINQLAAELLRNKRLLMWMTYLTDDPESPNNPKVNPKDVLGRGIVLTRVNEYILQKTEAKIFIAPKGGVDQRNTVLSTTVFEVNIVMPNALGYVYKLRKDRFAEIASEIAKSLDGQYITGIGDVKVSTNFNSYKINETYAGMMLHVTVANSRLMERRDV